jgi:hypothetical protein
MVKFVKILVNYAEIRFVWNKLSDYFLSQYIYLSFFIRIICVHPNNFVLSEECCHLKRKMALFSDIKDRLLYDNYNTILDF